MKKDILGRADIELAIKSFYNKVIVDPTIGYIFTDIAKVNWEKHLPVMYDFWENVIFFTGKYNGDPMNAHRKLNTVFTLNETHFRAWTSLFTETIDELFSGPNAEMAKQRALSIATVLHLKIIEDSENNKV